MTKARLVRHGNICRSLTAGVAVKNMVKKTALEKDFQIATAATSTEKVGSLIYLSAQRRIAEYGIRCDGPSARQLTNRDYNEYDLLIGIDQVNIFGDYSVRCTDR